MNPIAISMSPEEQELATLVQSLSEKGRALGLCVTPHQAPSVGAPELDIFDFLAARVRAGECIHITGPLDATVGQELMATISRLRRETGAAVRVIFS